MKINKDKFNNYFCVLNNNQTISYDKANDSYIIVSSINDVIQTTVIFSDVLDKLYNLSWEDQEITTSSTDVCQVLVPGTFIVCGEDNYQYCSEYCLNKS